MRGLRPLATMLRLLYQLSFPKKICLLVAIPLLGLIIFSAATVIDYRAKSSKTEAEITSVSELTKLSVDMANAIHEWQKERGRSAGFLGSKGQSFAKEIRAQYLETDVAAKQLSEALDTARLTNQPATYYSKLEKARDMMRKVEGWRGRVLKLEIPGGEAVGNYTALIRSFLEVIDESAHLTENSKISTLVISYTSFLRAKENMGIERAVLSNTFGADRFQSDFFKRYCTVLANQATHLANFRAYAKPEHITYFESTVKGPSVDQVAVWEKLAFEKADTGEFGVKPGDWFAKITDKINLMKDVENRIAADVQTSSMEIAASSSAKFITLLTFASITVVLSLILSTTIARTTSTSLRSCVSHLNASVNAVATNSAEVSDASLALASAANLQGSTLQDTTQALANISALTKSNTDLAHHANITATEAREMVDANLEKMESLQVAMNEIRTSSDEISAIIKTIDEIAFQTNILALNAAVEAARAGEAGAGFAVVADEVRNLAQRSAQAASDTTKKIEDSIQRAYNGTEISATVGEVLEQIVEKVRSVDEVVQKIDVASKSQLDAITSIESAVRSQEDSINSTSSTTQQTSMAAESLRTEAERMCQSIAHLAQQAGIENKTADGNGAFGCGLLSSSSSSSRRREVAKATEQAESVLWN